MSIASESTQHILHSAQNPIIYGGTFANVGGNMTINTRERPGLKRLLANIAPGAFHDAAERGDPPKCHPHTRVAILDEIMHWITAPGAREHMITWMYGPAGSGKTAIAQSIAEACAAEGRLAAAFFFGRLAHGRNTLARFAATLAYQLSRSIPELEDPMLAAVEKDPSVFSRSLLTQMRVLVVEPLRAVPLRGVATRVAVVDGVDECGPDEQAQVELLRILGAAVGALRGVPIVFLIASRPEYEIRTAFNRDPFSALTKSLVLDDQYEPDKDIKIYFDFKFRKVQQDHFPLSRVRWPVESDVALLVSKASGQFIFAATVMKFIDSPRYDPTNRLEIILGIVSAGTETPFALLDALYRFILGSVADVDHVLQVLTLLLLAGPSERRLGREKADELLGFDIRTALVDMHSLLFVPPPAEDALPRIYHASLDDFLRDRARSREFYVDDARGHAYLCRRWLKVVRSGAQSQIQTRIAVDALVSHCAHLESPANAELVDDLAHFDLRASLEGISIIWADIHYPNWSAFMDCIKYQGGGREDVFPRLQHEFDAFFLDRIRRYPASLQPHIPILLLDGPGSGEIFDILLHAACNSADEVLKVRRVDRGLLRISFVHSDAWSTGELVRELLVDRARAGRYVVDGGSYVALAKAIINVLLAKPRERNCRRPFDEVHEVCCCTADGFTPTMCLTPEDADLSWFEDVLDHAWIDLDLAGTLREHTIQFRREILPVPELDSSGKASMHESIAKASMGYIKRCGIAFLEHSHQPDPNEGAISDCSKRKRGYMGVDPYDDDRTAPLTAEAALPVRRHQ